MKYKAYINGQPYRMYRGNDGYSMNTYEEDCVIITCRYDDGYFAPHMPVDVDGEVYRPDQNGRIVIFGEKGTRRTLALTYDGVTKYIDVTFKGGTYEVRFYTKPESITFSITSPDANYIDCTSLKAGTYRCDYFIPKTIFDAQSGSIEGITIPLPNSTNQALIFQLGSKSGLALTLHIFYYDANGDTVTFYSKEHAASGTVTVDFTLTRTGD